MKIVLKSTFLVAVLALGVLGINNSFAQGDNEMMAEENETGLINSTGTMNATLAFAQEDIQTDDLVNETIDLGNNTGMIGMDYDIKMKLNGTIDIHSAIAEAFKSKVTTDIIGAIQSEQAFIGPNTVVKEAELTEAHEYLV